MIVVRAGGRKRGLFEALAAERSAGIGRLAAEAARSLGCGDVGLEAAGAVIRAGMLAAGCGMLGQLLAADPGHPAHSDAHRLTRSIPKMILTTYKLTRTPVDHERFYLLLALSAATVTSERRRR